VSYIIIILAIIVIARLMWDVAGWLIRKLNGVTITFNIDDDQ